MNCTICMNEDISHDNMVWLKCTHNLCSQCYDNLIQNACPYCRTTIDDNKTNNTIQQPDTSNLLFSVAIPTGENSYINVKHIRKKHKKKKSQKKSRFVSNKNRESFQRRKKKFKKQRRPNFISCQ